MAEKIGNKTFKKKRKKVLLIKKKKKVKVAVQEPVLPEYRDGGEGCIRWIEENCHVPVYPPGETVPEWILIGDLPREKDPLTNKSYWELWKEQCIVLKEGLKMEDGRFIYRLIVLCWQRGEGKSLLACLIQLWKFFCFPRQQIMLGANSKDQIKFVHYDIMRDIILNSPNLLSQIGKRNIQEKEIRFKDGAGIIRSVIRSISSFSGIVSNITGYTFSEMFDMKKPKFFVQLDGSIRNMPNALGVIDSTVSDRLHVLFQLYQGFIKKRTKTVYFSYRHSKLGDLSDYWNPNMTTDQLNDYKEKFPFGEFERYFLNLWSAGHVSVFTPEMIEETGYIGTDNLILNHDKVKRLLIDRNKLSDIAESFVEKRNHQGVLECHRKIEEIQTRFRPVDSLYSLKDKFGGIQMATMQDLQMLGDLLDTDWAILGGGDLADPMAIKGQARTIIIFIAKGLPGSRSTPITVSEASPKYIHFLLYMSNVPKHEVNKLKDEIDACNTEYAGIDTMCVERYGSWDLSEWCEERDIEFEAIHPNYDKQREAFKELYGVVEQGRFKVPSLGIPGSKSENIFIEEAGEFNHDPIKRVFGSTEKFTKNGIQDDTIYAIAWGLFGGRNKGVDDFMPRTSKADFGLLVSNTDLLMKY